MQRGASSHRSLVSRWLCLAAVMSSCADSTDRPAIDPMNATFIIEGDTIRLVNGHYEAHAVPGSATRTKTIVFGELAKGDLTGDDTEDVAMIVSHDPGGSGTFYYVVGATNSDGGYLGTNGVLMGDRIIPQSVAIRDGVIIARYLDRHLGESMSTTPSVERSKHLILEEGRLTEVESTPSSKTEQIIVYTPAPGALISSPLAIQGRARGSWFFEGDFPVLLTDSNGEVIAAKYATAKGDWMTSAFVPFEGEIEFIAPASGSRGTLVLKKDNPSDRPELDDQLELPVRFR